MINFSDESLALQSQLAAFMDEHIYPNESRYHEELRAGDGRFASVPLMEELKALAKDQGLWNLFIPPGLSQWNNGNGVSNYDYAPLGHAELRFEDVRVPLDSVLLGPGRGFEIAQGRLGPGRMHHCMRLIGGSQRALELACQRVSQRSTFGRPLSKHQSIRENIADCFADIEMARLLVLKTAAKMDEAGTQGALDMIAASKISVPRMMQSVVDRCMQMFGAGGLTDDYPLAETFNYARWCRQADGPDEVHQMSLGKQIINRYADS
ncbi:MAG: acyl-CoA dehydrogenase [Halieaceae bacterium]|jgi:acyl-CoA dehydrogenase